MSNSSIINMITSKEILVKTSISRATLNNYIKFGILPKPVVRSAGADLTGADLTGADLTGVDLTGVDLKGTKHIGYFPKDVLDNIATVKRLKREGRSMKEIVREFTQRQSVGEMYPHERTEETGSNHAADRQSLYLTSRTTDGNFALTIDNIDSPAFLLNHNFEIEWINHKAEDQIFKRIISKISDPESRNIFKIFLDLEFHAHIRNWEELITFYMGFMKINFTKDMLPTLFQGISDREISLLEKIYDKDSISVNSIQSFPLNLVMQDSSTKSYQVYSMLFREGIFFVYVQDQDGLSYNIKSLLSAKAKIINELLEQRMPSLVSLCVLVADLQNSVKISAELLPGEYFELINQLWATVTSSFDKYDGIYGKHTGGGMLYYFIKKPESNYIINSINCAIELKEQMKKFSDEWKVRKGWLNDLVLNIGISEGQEFLGTIRSSSNIELTTLGDSINYAANYAARLSDFALSGSIWTTKNLISKLDREEITKIRFGICRKKDGREIFLQNSFSRIIDLIDIDDRNYRKLIDVAMLPVTEIFGTTG